MINVKTILLKYIVLFSLLKTSIIFVWFSDEENQIFHQFLTI